MIRIPFLAAFAALSILAAPVFSAPSGGIFVPRNGGYEGCMGRSHVFVDRTAGGVIDFLKGDQPRAEKLARLDMVFAVKLRNAATPVEVRQSFDRSPEIIIIEEGNERTGIRVKFKLFDRTELYHGYGLTETWMYPDGTMFFSGGVCFEDSLAHAAVTDARLSLSLTDGYSTVTTGAAPSASDPSFALESARTLPLTDAAIPGRFLLLGGQGRPGLGMFWRTGKLDLYTWAARTYPDKNNTGAPSYFRWPTYLPQALPNLFSTATVPTHVRYGKGSADLLWLNGKSAGNVNPTFYTNLRFAVPTDAPQLRRHVEAERNLLTPKVRGGTIDDHERNHIGYIDNEGVYQIRKTGDPLTVTLPADPLGRTVYVKAICLDGHGAVTAELDGKPVVPHLVSEGGIADDPLAPLREQPEGPADMALVPVILGSSPRTLVIHETEGVQYAYQTRDSWRNVMCFSSETGKRRSGFRFSLVDGRMRNIRKYGDSGWALTENLLTWFKNCGQSPVDMIDQIRDFRVLKNGPDEAVFYYRSVDANERAQSEYTVRVPANAPAMTMRVSTTFTVLEYWPYTTNQFFDVFPFRGVDPREWWYDSVLWLTPDDRVKWESTKKWTFEGDKNLTEITGDGFFALCSADRGNMLILNRNFKPRLPVSYIICGNYIDYHMDVHFVDAQGRPKLPEKGFTMSMDYELALWGDAGTTREEIIEIGKRSLKAGKLVLPESGTRAGK